MTSSLSDFLRERGYVRLGYQRNALGHLVLPAEIAGVPGQVLVDTGASRTVVDVQWCRSHAVAVVETGAARRWRRRP